MNDAEWSDACLKYSTRVVCPECEHGKFMLGSIRGYSMDSMKGIEFVNIQWDHLGYDDLRAIHKGTYLWHRIEVEWDAMEVYESLRQLDDVS